MIPSQFNAAEYPYHTDVVFHVEDYKHENGSGPRGQLAVHPAVAQFLLDNAAGRSISSPVTPMMIRCLGCNPESPNQGENCHLPLLYACFS